MGKYQWICKVDTRQGDYFFRLKTEIDDRMEADKKAIAYLNENGTEWTKFRNQKINPSLQMKK